MDQCTENYECLVVNNNAKSNKLQSSTESVGMISDLLPTAWSADPDAGATSKTLKNTGTGTSELQVRNSQISTIIFHTCLTLNDLQKLSIIHPHCGST